MYARWDSLRILVMWIKSFVLFCLALFCARAVAADWPAQVVKVTDGDSLEVQTRGQSVRIRLAGIDAPESNQPYGMAAREALMRLVNGHTVRVVPTNYDQYGRVVADIRVGNIEVNKALVRAGHAWVYYQYSHDPVLQAAEREARSARRGLWANKAIPPWIWRRQGSSYSH